MSIYFALAPNGLMKIGLSKDPHRRVKTFKPRGRVVLKAVVVGDLRAERRYHMRFGRQYSHGEWFHYRGELRGFAIKDAHAYIPASIIDWARSAVILYDATFAGKPQ